MKVENEAKFETPYTRPEKLKRLGWEITWNLLYRPFPKWMLNGWKHFLLRRFGCKIADNAYVHPSARIFMPWNLELKAHACIAGGVDCYNPARITLGANVTVSKRAFLCTASHNISSPRHEQIEKPIVIGDRAWVAAEACVGPGVTIGEGAVVGARAAVFKDVEPWTVVGGNPAKFLKKRVIKEG
ncbi:MAG: putative colanic acid biosynthesis acetyltransferase [Mediterranea sp.]|jgi:putative colanic acid biosynthesis acetyltransferase WcaF|nr:putative colanic acid biosynthesis acetyltransferase [Mediterranea sp.]